MLAGMAAGSQAQEAGTASNEEAAIMVPRLDRLGVSNGIALPRPLGAGDVVRVRRIFELQRQGDLAAAQTLIAELEDTRLTGSILASLYLSRTYTATVAELRAWLERYGSQPDANPIYSL
ncbi:MAG: lytic transglycosylase domain-containing protein, partial [Acetobacteraceae bacterium]|nr:lytic transglycosylase domain-containing protein [Acetobacteraceae bacterium]